MRRDYRGKEAGNEAEIIREDIMDILLCDIFLMYFPFPSVGTSMELREAWRYSKQIIVVSHYQGTHSPWLIHHAKHIFDTFHTAYRWIEEYHALHSQVR